MHCRLIVPKTAKGGQTNIAFACALQLGDTTSCVDLLLNTDRSPEAALFSRTFAPSQTPRSVKAWRKTLEVAKKPKQASALADPEEQPEEFSEGWEIALEKEREIKSEEERRSAGLEFESVDGPALIEVEVEDYENGHVEAPSSNGFAGLSLGEKSPSLLDGEEEDDFQESLRRFTFTSLL